jgi:hypothetical protein
MKLMAVRAAWRRAGLFLVVAAVSGVAFLQASTFTDSGLVFTGLAQGASAWGDFDNDGDLDLLLCEEGPGGSSTAVTRLYRNDGNGVFTARDTSIPAVIRSAIALSDFDRDGWLDIAVFGVLANAETYTRRTMLFRNQGDLTFAEVPTPFVAVEAGGLNWGDLDADGDPDLLLAGYGPVTRVYRNDGAAGFSDWNLGLPDVGGGTGAWADYDGDLDLDVLLVGDTQPSPGFWAKRHSLFRNDGEAGFVEVPLPVLQPPAGTASFDNALWIDFNSDGRPDIFLFSNIDVPTLLRNDGPAGFTALSTGLAQHVIANAAWGDADNDGVSDLLLFGSLLGEKRGDLLLSNGAGGFTPAGLGINPPQFRNLLWADYDHDGRLDFLADGRECTTPESCLLPHLYRNTTPTANTPPSVPTGLSATRMADNSVWFTWNPALDGQTPSPGLSYELRVGTAPGQADVVAPPSDPVSGFRRVVAAGRVNGTNALLRTLPKGTYSWSVQAVDTAFAGSVFAAEQTLSITNAAPVIAPIPDQHTGLAVPVTVAFTVADEETPAGALSVSADSADQTLLPNASLELGGSGAERTLRLVSASGRSGQTTVTVTATDAAGTTSQRRFQLIVERFTEVDLGVLASTLVVSLSSMADLDNDADLDLVLGLAIAVGATPPPAALVGRNDGHGAFTWEPFAGGGAVLYGGDWADFDRDGDLDLVASLDGGAGFFRNDGGQFTRQPGPALPGDLGSVQCADLDRDGHPDVLVVGLSGNVTVFRNRGDWTFETAATFPGAGLYLNTWLDFDVDGRMDLFAGQRFLRNLGHGVFRDAGIDLGVSVTLLALDLNADGATDVLGYESAGLAFLNDGHGAFSRRDAGSFAFSGFAWGDFDFDGVNDLFVSAPPGHNPDYPARLYWNDRAGSFATTNTPLSYHACGPAIRGDVDGDGHLDMVTLGFPDAERVRLIRNNLDGTNAPPTAPGGLVAQLQTDDRVTLGWSRSTDDRTPAAALTYELRVGTGPGQGDVIAPRADWQTGHRRVPGPGALGAVNQVDLQHLAPGTYYWSVQAVDAAFVGSAWATEGSFVIAKPTVSPIGDQVTPPGIPSTAIEFTVSSPTTSAAQIQVSAHADDSTLIPGITLGGSGPQRWLVVMPSNQRGETFVTVTATDQAGFSDIVTFRVTVAWFENHPFAPPLLTTPGNDFAWVDLDTDGWLDLLGLGAHEGIPTNAFSTYVNARDGRLEPVSIGLPPGFGGKVLPGDLDGDNRPDVLLSGLDSGDPVGPRNEHRVWHPDGALAFSPLTPQLTHAAVALPATDLDGNGLADVASWGDRQAFGLPLEAIGDPKRGFALLTPGATLNYLAGVVWADLDNDGTLDLVFSGHEDGVSFLRVMRGDAAGRFTALGSGVPTNMAAFVGAADADSDGWLDLFIAPASPDAAHPPRIWRNLGDFQFASTPATFAPELTGIPVWGDFDNDGHTDLFLLSTLFRNDGLGGFSAVDAGLPTVTVSSAAWGDTDNDGDLDLFLTGSTGWNQVGRLLAVNACSRSNAPPVAPTGLTATSLGEQVRLGWLPGLDAENASNLTYNVRVGTTPGGSQIVSAVADPITGRRRLSGPGNSGPAPRRVLGRLPNGTYYWTAQSVDAAYAASAFAPEASFRVSRPSIEGLTNLTVAANAPVGPILFRVGDAETAPGQLRVTVTADNPDLIPGGNLQLGGTGADRYLQFTPAPHQAGTARLTVSVEDAAGEINTATFLVTVREEFARVLTDLPALGDGVAGWVDADGDSDLDLVLGGFVGIPYVGGTGRADLWRNDNGTVTTNRIAVLDDAGGGALAFADVNHDGLVDFALSGGPVLSQFYSQATPGAFTQVVPSPFAGVTRSAAAWGDPDADGDADLLQSGALSVQLIATARTWIYSNLRDSSFFPTTFQWSGLRDGTAHWVDVDGDGDDDLLMTGAFEWNAATAHTWLYRNDGGQLSLMDSGLPDVTDSAAAIADVDLDGAPDVVLCGRSFAVPEGVLTKVFRNDGTGHFSEIATQFPGFAFGSAAWGDCDGDGDPDLFLSGTGTAGDVSQLWVNDGGVFSRSGNRFDGGCGRGTAWGDFDGDGDLDLIVSGSPDDGWSPPRLPGFTGLFRNELNHGVTAPPVPVQLAAEAGGTDLILQWQLPAGAPGGLSFNLRAGTSPGAIDIVSPMADLSTGRRQVVAAGNAGWSFQRRLRNFAGQTVYWSVQSIDPAFRASPFATEQTSLVTRNEGPTISTVAFQSGPMNAVLGPIAFTIDDVDDDPFTLSVSATSSNPNVVPDDAVELIGAGPAWEITLTPLPNASGVTTITLTVSDPHGSTARQEFRAFFQAATEILTALPQFLPTALEPADVDDDGDVDLFFAGWEPIGENSGRQYHDLFRQTDAAFAPLAEPSLPGGDIRATWGDCDGDGDLDLFAGGVIHRNEGGWFVADLPLGADPRAAGAWGDFDGDGDLDLAVAGGDSRLAFVLRNAAGVFENLEAAFVPVYDGAVAWGDPDNDGDLDLAISGRESDVFQSFPQLRVYRNDAGVFTEVRHFLGAREASLQWADANRDGRVDLLAAGTTPDGPRERLYFNLGRFEFLMTDPHPDTGGGVAGLPGAALFDLDNDGAPDLAEFTASTTFGVRLNDGNGQFSPGSRAFANVPAGILRYADFDQDGDYDIWVAGRTRTGVTYDGSVRIYRNLQLTTPPVVDRLTARPNGTDVDLEWPARSDFGPGSPVTYNFRVGTWPGGGDIVSPLSDPVSGARHVVAPGNVGFARRTRLRGLAPGTYHWSVQPVDAAFRGGPFATEAMFTLLPAPATTRIEAIEIQDFFTLRLTVAGAVGSLAVVETSANLTDWTPQSPQRIGVSGRELIQAGRPASAGFYRVRVVP